MCEAQALFSVCGGRKHENQINQSDFPSVLMDNACVYSFCNVDSLSAATTGLLISEF